MEDKLLRDLIVNALAEDLGDGDHTSLACIPADSAGKAGLIVRQHGMIAGIRVAGKVFSIIDPDLSFKQFIDDGKPVIPGDIAFHVSGTVRSILKSERIILNIMQRMSGIATSTNEYVTRLQIGRAHV